MKRLDTHIVNSQSITTHLLSCTRLQLWVGFTLLFRFFHHDVEKKGLEKSAFEARDPDNF